MYIRAGSEQSPAHGDALVYRAEDTKFTLTDITVKSSVIFFFLTFYRKTEKKK